ncbi:cell division protein FtsA [Candidatus Saccharibacteria bacterium]|nr:cell division protein FtsA [Candidatus Saccharibacteria bacterium]
MAAQKHEATFVGLDIGTSKVVCVVGLHQQDLATPSIIGLGVAPVTGLKRGVVTDVEETVSAITTALEEAERMSGVAIERATINIDGAHVQSTNTSGVVAVARADREIVAEDLARVEAVASAVNLEANRQIISVIPKSYHVDDQRGVTDPVGMHGIKLEMDAHIIAGAMPAIKNLDNAVFRSGIAINQHIVTPIAAAKALVSNQQKDLGVAVVHFGSETTGIVVYSAGVIIFTGIVPLGSNHITKDLVYGLRTSLEVAEKLKVEHGVARKPKGKTNHKLSLEEYGSAGNVYQYDIDTIISSRLEEIFVMVKDQLQKALEGGETLGSGIIITGGGANMPELTHFARSILNTPTHLGRVTGYTGISDKISDPLFTSAVGLMLLDMEAPTSHSHRKLGQALPGIIGKIKSIFKGLMP